MIFLGKFAASLKKFKSSLPHSPLAYFRSPPAIMLPLFSISAALIGLLIWSGSPLRTYLDSPWMLGTGFGCLALAVGIYWLPRLHYSWSYDLFCTASLLIWFFLWQGVYQPNAPVFQIYPLYFVMLTVLLPYVLIRNPDLNQVEGEGAKLLRLTLSYSFFHPLIFFSLTLWAVTQPDYYLTYPIFMSLLLIRYALSECFHNQPIVYFQLKQKPVTPSLFSEFIYPIARKYGPIIVLMRSSDSFSTTTKPTNYKNAMIYRVTEEQWEQWLQKGLKHCFAILLDLRQATQNAEHKLQEISLQVAHHRIIVLCDDPSELLIPDDILYFSSTQLSDKQSFQTALEQWFKQTLRPL